MKLQMVQSIIIRNVWESRAGQMLPKRTSCSCPPQKKKEIRHRAQHAFWITIFQHMSTCGIFNSLYKNFRSSIEIRHCNINPQLYTLKSNCSDLEQYRYDFANISLSVRHRQMCIPQTAVSAACKTARDLSSSCSQPSSCCTTSSSRPAPSSFHWV